MIHSPTLFTIAQEFERRARHREEERLTKDRDFLDKQKRKDEREARDERHEEVEMFAIAAFATEQDIQFAMIERDIYGVATVEALILNREALERAEEQVRIILDRAYVLPDGRRVFKTEDGTQVFDEHGVEVKDFDPDEIEDERPYWETFRAAKEVELALTAEREQILEYQARLDEAKDRLDAGEITKDELDDLMTGLRKDMPDAVRANLPEDAAPALAADRTAEADPAPQRLHPLPTARLDMPAL